MTSHKLTVLLFGLLSLVFGGYAFAALPTVNEYTGQYWGQGVWHGSAAEACTAAALNRGAAVGSGYSNFVGTLSGVSCSISAKSNSTGQVDPSWGGDQIISRGGACPANSNLSGGQCQCVPGYTEQGGQCVEPANECKGAAGEIRTINFTIGWARSGVVDAADYLGGLKWPDQSGGGGSICTGGCSGSFPESPFVDAFRSQEPSPQGLYRISADYLVRMDGGQCMPGESDKAHDPTTPNMQCPGYVGTVNGKTVCVGTADKPLPPPAGNEPSRNTGEAPDKGNPSAGPKPSQGEGSGDTGPGRTPANGNGGNDGGPRSAAGTGSGDGTTDKPDDGKEQQNCGAPGQPPCKLDESGTPGTFSPNSGVKDYKDTMDQQREQIKGAGDGVFSGLNVFFSAPPVVGCTPFSLPNEMGSIDPCAVVDGVRSVMAYLWAIAALWLCLGWIREAV